MALYSKTGRRRPVRVFEAFSGIGAQKAALERLHQKYNFKYEIVGTSDWFINAILAYDAIHCSDIPVEVPCFNEQLEYLKQFTFSADSIRPIKNIAYLPKEIIEKLYIANKRTKNLGSIKDIRGEIMPDTDLLFYSFPCQDLSTGGNGHGMAKGANTRSGLVWEIERILNDLNAAGRLPEYLVMENVNTILSPRHKPELDKWLGFLEGLGYSNDSPMTLNSKEFMVPQERTRTLIVSHLGGGLNIKDRIIKPGLVNDTRTFLRYDYKNPTFKKEADDASINLTASRKTMWEINGREISADTIIRTITCNMDRTNTSVLFEYGDKIRRLTIREAFLMMGFAEGDYEKILPLGLTYRQANKLIGNSIVVNVLQALFEAMFISRRKVK